MNILHGTSGRRLFTDTTTSATPIPNKHPKSLLLGPSSKYPTPTPTSHQTPSTDAFIPWPQTVTPQPNTQHTPPIFRSDGDDNILFDIRIPTPYETPRRFVLFQNSVQGTPTSSKGKVRLPINTHDYVMKTTKE